MDRQKAGRSRGGFLRLGSRLIVSPGRRWSGPGSRFHRSAWRAGRCGAVGEPRRRPWGGCGRLPIGRSEQDRVGGDHPSRESCSEGIVFERHFVLKGCRNAAPITSNSKIDLTGRAGQVTRYRRSTLAHRPLRPFHDVGVKAAALKFRDSTMTAILARSLPYISRDCDGRGPTMSKTVLYRRDVLLRLPYSCRAGTLYRASASFRSVRLLADDVLQ